MSNGDAVETLIMLGLTHSQAKIYLTLVIIGTAPATTIAQASHMDRSETYRQLLALQENSLVEKILANPTEYKAIPLKNALSLLLRRRDRINKELLEKTQKIMKRYPQNNIPTNLAENKNEFVILPKKETLIRHMKDYPTKTEWCCPIPLRTLAATLAGARENVLKDLSRGVLFRIITDQPKDKESLPKIAKFLMKNPHFKIRLSKTPIGTVFGVIDNQIMYCFITHPEGVADQPLLWSSNRGLIEVFKKQFEIMWDEALKYKPEKTKTSKQKIPA